MSLKFCPKCGNKLEPDASFCERCGTDLRVRTEMSDIQSPALTETAQKPKFKQEALIYAPFLKRIIAIIFDSIFIGLIGSAFSWFVVNPWFPINFFDPFGAWWFTFPFDWLVGFLYHWLMESQNNGQTIGKMALNIRTVDENTLKQADSRNLALNNIFKSSPFLILDFLIGVFKNSGDPKKRIRIMQNISETVVILT
jgi:uncharacterized RDD family membrane protein YckC